MVLTAEAMEKVGKSGVITVQDGKAIDDTLEITEGMRFDRGFISPYLITDSKAQKAEFDDAVILITEKKVCIVQDPPRETWAAHRRPELTPRSHACACAASLRPSPPPFSFPLSRSRRWQTSSRRSM